NKSNRRRVVGSTREGSSPHRDGPRSLTPQMWNHSSTSTVSALINGSCGRRARPLRLDEGGDGIDRSQDLHAGFLVLDGHAERSLELEHELQTIHRAEAA